MANFYCANCGRKYPTVQWLVTNTCAKHPNGAHKGNHVLYQGAEKPRYTCMYCGQQYPTIESLTNAKCQRHPDGRNVGFHSPAL